MSSKETKMNKTIRAKYTLEFKREAVRLVENG
jgi:transposase-like protein